MNDRCNEAPYFTARVRLRLMAPPAARASLLPLS